MIHQINHPPASIATTARWRAPSRTWSFAVRRPSASRRRSALRWECRVRAAIRHAVSSPSARLSRRRARRQSICSGPSNACGAALSSCDMATPPTSAAACCRKPWRFIARTSPHFHVHGAWRGWIYPSAWACQRKSAIARAENSARGHTPPVRCVWRGRSSRSSAAAASSVQPLALGAAAVGILQPEIFEYVSASDDELAFLRKPHLTSLLPGRLLRQLDPSSRWLSIRP